MVPEDDARNTVEYETYFAILPSFAEWDAEGYTKRNGNGKRCAADFSYNSGTNTEWLTEADLHKIVQSVTDEKHG